MLNVGDIVRVKGNPIGIAIETKDFRGEVGAITNISKNHYGQFVYRVCGYWFNEDELKPVNKE